jgi:nucleoside-diphosphate-sugar epimerase
MSIKLVPKVHVPLRESLPRMVADFLVIHLCMLTAITVSIGMQILFHTPEARKTFADVYFSYYAAYYGQQFVSLSAIFPITFALHGFYTQSRRYTSRHKILVVAQGAAIACLLFLAADFLLFRNDLIPRSAELVFAAFAIVSIPSIRMVKHSFLRHFQISARTEIPPSQATSERVLVVGGAGYIGSILVRRLLAMGKTVRVLDSLLYGEDPIRGIKEHPRFELFVGDCRNIQNVVRAVQNIDSIIDLAAIVGDPACEEDRQAALEINYAATRMLIEIAKGHAVRQFIFASSCSVYGASNYVSNEKCEVNPISLYAQTKVDSENALLEASSASFSPVVLRFATVFGHSFRPRFDLVVNLLTAKAFQDSLVTIYNGQQWRPFIHVRDVCEAIVEVMKAPCSLTGGQIFNVGDSRFNYTLTQVAEKIRDRFPHTRIEHVENADRRDYRVSFDKMREQIGFQCSIDLDEGIAELHEAFLSGEIADYGDPRYHNQRFLKRSGVFLPPHELDTEVMAAFAHMKSKVTAAAAAT